jgi:hypothetical protein
MEIFLAAGQATHYDCGDLNSSPLCLRDSTVAILQHVEIIDSCFGSNLVIALLGSD